MAHLLKLVLSSSSAQRGYQQVLPALWAAVGSTSSSSSTSSVLSALQQPTGTAAVTAQLPPSSRGFHVGRPLFSADKELASVLAQEVKHERTVYEPDELVEGGPPAPFKLSTTPGDTTVTLTRDFKGETISVDASINMQDSLAMFDAEDEEQEEEEPNDINFNVSVSREGQALVFECTSDGTYVDIRHVSLEPASGVASETAYTGPVFGELDEALQGAFRDYLAERGINEDLGEFLRHLLYDKEQQEYSHWLQGVHDFVGKRSSS